MSNDDRQANGWFDAGSVGGSALDQGQAGVNALDSSHTAQLKVAQWNHEQLMASGNAAGSGSYSTGHGRIPNPFFFLKLKTTWLLMAIAALVFVQLKLFLPPQPLEIVVSACITAALVFMVSSLASKFSLLKAAGLMLLLLVIAALSILVPLIYYPQSKTSQNIDSVLMRFLGPYIPRK